MTDPNELIEAWEINQRVNLMLLDAIEPDALAFSARPRSRSVGDQFAHLHTARIMWLEHGAPDLVGEMTKVKKGEHGGHDRLREILTASCAAMSAAFRRAGEKGKLRGWKRSPTAFLGYMLAHEAHHRGQMILTLKQNGVKFDRHFLYELWEWKKI